MDINNGIFKITNDLVVSSNYTFEDFKKTKYYNAQDGIRVIYLTEKQVIDNKNFLVSLFFRNDKIYMLSLICCDAEYTEEDEYKRKLLHDMILKKWGVIGKGKYKWGTIGSVYDARSNISSINIIF